MDFEFLDKAGLGQLWDRFTKKLNQKIGTIKTGTVKTVGPGTDAAEDVQVSGTVATINFQIPRGETGGKGDTGAAGTRGSRWSTGTAITGTSTTAAVFSGSGITDALVNDMYLNTSTGYVYRCTTAGAAGVAKWVYAGSINGSITEAGITDIFKGLFTKIS